MGGAAVTGGGGESERVESTAGFQHLPVLLEETLEAMAVRPGGRYIDATLGGGGHAEAILERSGPDGALLGVDRDGMALEAAQARLERFGGRFTAVRGDFGHLGEIARGLGWIDVDGILLDLGVSSPQLDRAERGFSFRRAAPLDMRMDDRQSLTAADVIRQSTRRELTAIFRDFGEEPRADRIAGAIVDRRRVAPIDTTIDLAELVRRVAGKGGGRIHPATRVFQALRMKVNDELGQLAEAIPAAVGLLAEGGRLAVIDYHSLEDQVVKDVFRYLGGGCRCPHGQPVCTCRTIRLVDKLAKRSVRPTLAEERGNRRARSARLRAVVKRGKPS